MSAVAIRKAEAAVVEAFDYSALEAPAAERLRARSERIRKFGRQTVEIAGKIGQELLQAQQELEHGQFLAWVENDVGMSKSAAYRAMDMAQTLGPKLPTLGSLPLAVVHQIAAKSTPEPLRAEIVGLIEAGVSPKPEDIVTAVREARAKVREERETAELKAKLDKMSPEERKANNTKAKRQARERERRKAEWKAVCEQEDVEKLRKLEAASGAVELVIQALGDKALKFADLAIAAEHHFIAMLRERLGIGRSYTSPENERLRLRHVIENRRREAEGLPRVDDPSDGNFRTWAAGNAT